MLLYVWKAVQPKALWGAGARLSVSVGHYSFPLLSGLIEAGSISKLVQVGPFKW